jgi:hypothetical protein
MLTIYKIEMNSKLGYWEATCGVDGRAFVVQAVAWIDFLTKDLMVLQVGGSNPDSDISRHLPEVDKAMRRAVEARLAE